MDSKVNVEELIRVERLTDNNSAIRMLVYNMFAIIFPPPASSGSRGNCNANIELIKNLKCTAYSKDIKLKLIKHSGLPLQDDQIQTILAHFFNEITLFHDQTNSNVLTFHFCIWVLHENPLL